MPGQIDPDFFLPSLRKRNRCGLVVKEGTAPAAQQFAIAKTTATTLAKGDLDPFWRDRGARFDCRADRKIDKVF